MARGQYGILLAIALVPLLGFGALSLDLALLSWIASQADATAYAAAHTAIVAYRDGRTRAESEALARSVLTEMPVGFDGTAFTLGSLSWGTVDRSTGTLIPSARVEAAEAVVERDGADAVSLLLARIIGVTRTDVQGHAISDQIPSRFSDACDVAFRVEGTDGAITRRSDFQRVLSYELFNEGPSGWYALYKSRVAESGPRQRNESSYFRVPTDRNPSGRGLDEDRNCGDDYVVVDYDNDGELPDRVYIGTFYLEGGAVNTLEMRHYCAIRDRCPELEDPIEACGDSFDSVHFWTGRAVCGQALQSGGS